MKNNPRIIHIKEVISTNQSLRERLNGRSLPEGSVVWADYQTSGRGQMGNGWESERGKNLTFSTVLYPEVIPANHQFVISQITALSVQETLSEYTPDISIKWPNDIYWRDKKICGMLIENDLAGNIIYCSIQGIGININQTRFQSDAPNPVSLRQITGSVYDREEILHKFLTSFYAYYLFLLQDKEEEIRRVYQKALYRKDGFYPYQDDNGCFEACIEEVEPSGHLILRLRDNSLRRYAFKEVRFMR